LDIRALRRWSLENVEHPEREEDAKDILTVLRDKERRQTEEMESMMQGQDSAAVSK